ncbi:Pentatricopeptide repeat [Macleaya cordata]|uniref:Pentatricopeptide repeat n=1 Tax=Macleaya cordata TaxID=56857 RepID=A0A200QP31_MACCD|nr:Pentatricopeptide repeat [Macleaya cordata]
MKDLKQIHSHIIQTGFSQDLFVVGKIITYCAVSDDGLMDYAVSVFEQIQNPDGFLWNTMIRGFGRTSKPEEAFEFYKRMLDNGEKADNFTYSFLLKICAEVSAVQIGKQIHCCTLKNGLDSHVFVRNTLIYMYGMFRDIETSRYLFEEIPKPDLVAWNTIIDCYVNGSHCKEALDLFLRMQQNGVEPDEATLVIVLSACSDSGALDFGMWVHSRIDHMGLNHVLPVSNSLIDMYAKCGEIEKARHIFSKMNKRNIITWNSMILGLAMHGYADEALEFFSNMQRLNLDTPNDITFLGVLCACSHRGLVDEGRKYFHSMSRDYNIRPTIKHYGCMVDLLGRAGFVEEAYQMIQSMSMKCNAIVWRALLGACRVHGHLELGEQVRKHLEELEPDHSGDYVLLANMYASEGRWNDVMRVRKAMRGRGVQKPEPGNSLINTNSTVFLDTVSTKPGDKAISNAKKT